ncbi:MAG: hypothetical protein EOP45_04130 [Sphingobacteriaceae bacterium]|nr:MAG: hypothetical protein EOP45_04130 [Sphingobacteriaceae bacterium]
MSSENKEDSDQHHNDEFNFEQQQEDDQLEYEDHGADEEVKKYETEVAWAFITEGILNRCCSGQSNNIHRLFRWR